MSKRLPVLLLLVLSFLPCGTDWDACAEDSGAVCSTGCHLGCAVAPVPASTSSLAVELPLVIARGPAIAARPLLRPHLPETPPPRA